MQCPRCGGWHLGGTQNPPVVNYVAPDVPELATARQVLCNTIRTIAERATQRDPYSRDVLPQGHATLWEPRIYGADERGEEVTVAFGRTNSSRENHYMIADGHISNWKFFDEDKKHKGHDHVWPTGHTDRGKYSGWDAFSNPDER